ncbi:uncharacterized protein LOC117316174 [Pecten maximus]|uniref:uncharacterized protein LOC117316174 n=1 Tax=Pecten maximus TaxID=6579 RepID=UPI00145857D0|nr:uncharacterized protein LOC117316174 [Pecten maximus]
MPGIPVHTFYPRIPNKSCAISNLEKRNHDLEIDLKFRTQSVTSTPYQKLNYGHHPSLSPVDDSGYTSITSCGTIDNSAVQEFQTPISGFFQHPGRQLAFTPLSPVPCERTVEYHPSFSEVSSRFDSEHDRDWEIPEDKVKFNLSYRSIPQYRLNFDEGEDEVDDCFEDESICDLKKTSFMKSPVSDYHDHESDKLLTDSPHSRLSFECDQKVPCDCQCTNNTYMSEESELISTSASLNASSLADRFNEVLQKFSPKEPDRLIGRKMGLLCVDIVFELSMRNISALSVIFGYLDPQDLCSFCQVSKDWKSICDEDKKVTGRRVQYIQQQRNACSNKLEKENLGKRLEHRSERGLTEGERTFGMLQQTVSSSKANNQVPENLFHSVASTLKNYESLRRCPEVSGSIKSTGGPGTRHVCPDRLWVRLLCQVPEQFSL